MGFNSSAVSCEQKLRLPTNTVSTGEAGKTGSTAATTDPPYSIDVC